MTDSSLLLVSQVVACHGGCDCQWPRFPAYRAVFCKEIVICAQTKQHAYLGLGIMSEFCERLHKHADYQHDRRSAIRAVAAEMLGVAIGRIEGIPTGELVRKVVLDGTRGKAQLSSLRKDGLLSSRLCDYQ